MHTQTDTPTEPTLAPAAEPTVAPPTEPAPTPPAEPTYLQTLTDAVQQKLTASMQPLALKDLQKGLPKPPKVKKKKGEPTPEKVDPIVLLQSILDDGLNTGGLFQYPSGKAGAIRYWTTDERQQLQTAILREAATPLAMKKLKAAIGKHFKGTDPAFIDATVRDLLIAQQLFEHPTKKGEPLVGVSPPLPPLPPLPILEQKQSIKFVKAFLTATDKLLAATHVSHDVLIACLQKHLGHPSHDPVAPTTPSETPPMPPTVVAVPPSLPPIPPPVIDLRKALRAAYDHLCLFVEYRDKLVRLAPLFHETATRVAGLTVPQYHAELEALSREWKIELQVLNEVAEAKEPELAIHRDGRMYYYVMWK